MFKYEVIDGQHYRQVFNNFLNATESDRDYQKKVAAYKAMQATHVAKIFVATNSHGKEGML